MNRILAVLLSLSLTACGSLELVTPEPAGHIVVTAPVGILAASQDATEAPPVSCMATVTAEKALNLRTRPFEGAQALYPELAPGDILTVLREGFGQDGDWLAVIDGTGRIGYVHGSFVRKDCR